MHIKDLSIRQFTDTLSTLDNPDLQYRWIGNKLSEKELAAINGYLVAIYYMSEWYGASSATPLWEKTVRQVLDVYAGNTGKTVKL